MPTIEEFRRRPVLSTVACIIVIVCLSVLGRNLMARPQIGADQEVFKTVDALFTAVTSKDKSRLEDCHQRLKEYQQEGKLPPSAARRLEAIIKQAEEGQWQASAKTLYDFMLAQRGL